MSQVLKQRNINDLFKAERVGWVDAARAAARRLLLTKPYITIEDVLKETPRPAYIHRNTTGQIFKHEDFKTCGYQKSNSRAAKGRFVFQWKLREENLQLTMQQLRRNRRASD